MTQVYQHTINGDVDVQVTSDEIHTWQQFARIMHTAVRKYGTDWITDPEDKEWVIANANASHKCQTSYLARNDLFAAYLVDSEDGVKINGKLGFSILDIGPTKPTAPPV